MKPIAEFSDQHRFLSNFYPSPFYFDGNMYKTNEHFYQSQKVSTKEQEQLIINCETPHEAKSMARGFPMAERFQYHKDNAMLLGLRLKFISNPFLTQLLLATRDRELIEGNTWGDTYWGVCKGVGLNRLGLGLMKVRKELIDVKII